MGEIVGGEDCLKNRPRLDTLKCRSLSGELLEISYEEFAKQTKKVENSFETFESMALIKEDRRTKMMDYVKNADEAARNGKILLKDTQFRRSRTPNRIKTEKTQIYETPQKSQKRIFKELGIYDDPVTKSTSLVVGGIPKQLTPMFAHIKNRILKSDNKKEVAEIFKRANTVRRYRPKTAKIQNSTERSSTPAKISRTERLNQSGRGSKIFVSKQISTIIQTPELPKNNRHARENILRTTKK